jgi:drug/metabolite transporter (DMT)-like permease
MHKSGQLSTMAVVGAVTFSLVAFAGNSLLTRAALVDASISVPGFVLVRLASAAVVLTAIALWRRQALVPGRGDLAGVLSLSIYAIAFTFAYVSMGAALGALLLFVSVQATMVLTAWLQGNRPATAQLLGMTTALTGLVFVLLPGLQTGGGVESGGIVPILGMVAAGVAWGAYTLLGRGGGDALSRTARNFNGASLLALAFVPFALSGEWRGEGFVLASLSGAITSGLGYAVWYRVLPSLSVVSAGVLQLLVPALAAAGGVLLLSERMQSAQVIGTAVILLGIGLTIPRSKRA